MLRPLLPPHYGKSQAAPPEPHRVFESVAMATDEVQAARLAVCRDNCPDNFEGRCRACCGGGTPLEVIVKLNVSKCARKRWKE
jgi:hypothetical protein